jgi:hypothetical protein
MKITRVQRLIDIRLAREYRKVSNEALCIITDIKIEEAAQLYQLTRGSRKDKR